MPALSLRHAKGELLALAVLVAWACNPPTSVTGGDDDSAGARGGTGGRSSAGRGGASGQSTGTGGSLGANGGTGGTAAANGGSSGVTTGGAGGSGRSASGGASGAGRSASGGAGPAGGAQTTGGASPTGGAAGVASGGMPAGGTSSGGTTGGTGAAGVPNDPNWKPPDMTATAKLIVYYQASQTAASSTDIRFTLTMKNQTDAQYDLTNVTIRYWLSMEPPPRIQIFYSSTGISLNGVPTFVGNNANSYLEFTFKKGGVVPVYTTADSINQTQIQVGVDSTVQNQKFNQANDWSFDATAGASKPNPKITAYDGDVLIWGCDPSHVCAGGDTTGEGGAGGQPN
jgi:hypothetical protein